MGRRRDKEKQYLTEEDINRVLDSLSDNLAYHTFNAAPVDRMLAILNESFSTRPPSDSSVSLDLRDSSSSRRPRSRSPPSSSSSLSLSSSYSSFYSYSSSFASRYMGGGAQLSHDHATQFTFVLQSLTLWREIMVHRRRGRGEREGRRGKEMRREEKGYFPSICFIQNIHNKY